MKSIVNCNVKNNIEVRILSDDELMLQGFLPTNELSEILFCEQRKCFFKEKIARGAYKNILIRKYDTPLLLINHDYNKRVNVRKFDFYEDDKGLHFSYIIKSTNEVLKNITKISALSFGFKCLNDLWINVIDDETKRYDYERIITKFSDLMEISLLIDKLPAYSNTSVFIGNNNEEVEKKEAQKLIEGMKNDIRELKMKEINEVKDIISNLKIS